MLHYRDKIPTITWLGKVATGEFGDVKQIRKAIETLLKEKQGKVNVMFDCQDLGVFISERKTNKVSTVVNLYCTIITLKLSMRAVVTLRIFNKQVINYLVSNYQALLQVSCVSYSTTY